MKKQLLFFAIILFFSIGTSIAQKHTLKHTVYSSEFVLEGKAFQILGEVTNNTGKMLNNIQINVNFYDASGKILKSSNFIDESYNLQYSDMQPAESDYLATNSTIPFKFLRFVDKVNGKIAKADVVVTGNEIKANTKAIIENFKTEKKVEYGVTSFLVTGDFKCTAGKVFNCNAILAGYDINNKIIDVQSVSINAEEISAGKTVNFSGEFYENTKGVVKVLAFPSYRGDWDEK